MNKLLIINAGLEFSEKKIKAFWCGLKYKEKIKILKSLNWHIGRQVKSYTPIFRRRKKHVCVNGRAFLGGLFYTIDGYVWEDMGGNISNEELRSKPDAVMSFVLSRAWGREWLSYEDIVRDCQANSNGTARI